MRETDFIDQNKKKWSELERLSKAKAKDPDSLSELFVEVCNDLSYAKSYYPNRSIRVYLNNLAQSIHATVYKNRLGAWKKFKSFWTEELPRVMHESRKDLLISFLIFALSMFIGVFSSMNDSGFARHILGDSYVEMTEEYIETGDPMAVYKKSKNTDMFVYITINNLRVSFLVFVLGAFFSIGTISVLIYNGVMVGTFQYFFFERGLFQESFLTIWMHGMPEIMSIVIAGAAGLTLGRGLIFPGTYSRKESFLIAARRGIMIMVGISPIIIFSAFIEGFATRYTQTPDIARGAIILLSASFMIYYFVIYPWLKYGRGAFAGTSIAKIPEAAEHDFGLEKDKKNPQIYTDIFALYSRTVFYLIPRFFGLAILYVLTVLLISGGAFSDIFTTSSGVQFSFNMFIHAIQMAFIKVDQLFRYAAPETMFFYLVNSVFFALVCTTTLRLFATFYQQDTDTGGHSTVLSFFLLYFPWILLVSLVSNLIFFISTPLSFFVMLLVFPLTVQFVGNRFYTKSRDISFMEGMKISLRSYGPALGLLLTTMVTAILFILIFNSGLIDFLLEHVLWNFKMEAETYNIVILAIKTALTFFALAMVTPLFVYGSSFGFYAAYEKETASGLKKEIARIGTQKSAYGLAREES